MDPHEDVNDRSPNNALQPTAISPLRGSMASLAALGAAERGRWADEPGTILARRATACDHLGATMSDDHEGDGPLYFYSTQGTYGSFSNFARIPVTMGGKTWPTSEHYFQAQKFGDPALKARIRKASTPSIAARLGRDRSNPLRRDWEAVKVDVMRDVVYAKFSQHHDLRALLLSTGNRELVEHTDRDAFWGDGGDGSGNNMLGRVLMEVRSRLRER